MNNIFHTTIVELADNVFEKSSFMKANKNGYNEYHYGDRFFFYLDNGDYYEVTIGVFSGKKQEIDVNRSIHSLYNIFECWLRHDIY